MFCKKLQSNTLFFFLGCLSFFLFPIGRGIALGSPLQRFSFLSLFWMALGISIVATCLGRNTLFPKTVKQVAWSLFPIVLGLGGYILYLSQETPYLFKWTPLLYLTLFFLLGLQKKWIRTRLFCGVVGITLFSIYLSVSLVASLAIAAALFMGLVAYKKGVSGAEILFTGAFFVMICSATYSLFFWKIEAPFQVEVFYELLMKGGCFGLSFFIFFEAAIPIDVGAGKNQILNRNGYKKKSSMFLLSFCPLVTSFSFHIEASLTYLLIGCFIFIALIATLRGNTSHQKRYQFS